VNQERQEAWPQFQGRSVKIPAPAMFEQGEVDQREYFYVAHMNYGQCRLQRIRGDRLSTRRRRSAGHSAVSHPSGARPCKCIIIMMSIRKTRERSGRMPGPHEQWTKYDVGQSHSDRLEEKNQTEEGDTSERNVALNNP
jgi:hypothetical protein